MPLPQLTRLVRQNLRRNLKHNLLSSIGIVVGIASLTFFLALDAGVRRVLAEIFPVDRIEMIPPKATLLGGSRRITDAVVERLRQPPPEVGAVPAAVYPKMKLAFPARGWGGKNLFGRNYFFELSGFVDGVDSSLMKGQVKPPLRFEDWLGSSEPSKCKPGNRCPSGYYCAWDVYRCHRPVPVMISRYMIELYNGSIARSHPRMPKIPDFVTSVFAGRTFTAELGRSYFGSSARKGKAVQRRFQLVGVSDRAADIGLTVPLGYIKRWNRRYAGEREASSYSSAVIVVTAKRDITPLAAYVKSLGFDLAENQGELVGVFVTLATVLFALISLIIILIAAINISHTFMMLIADRRREIGVLRAVGATRGHIRAVILGEAGVVGLVGGPLGVALAYGVARLCDWYSMTQLPDFPFKPESYFGFSPLLVFGTVGFAALFCVLGALVPAQRAARMEPAEALSTR